MQYNKTLLYVIIIHASFFFNLENRWTSILPPTPKGSAPWRDSLGDSKVEASLLMKCPKWSEGFWSMLTQMRERFTKKSMQISHIWMIYCWSVRVGSADGFLWRAPNFEIQRYWKSNLKTSIQFQILKWDDGWRCSNMFTSLIQFTMGWGEVYLGDLPSIVKINTKFGMQACMYLMPGCCVSNDWITSTNSHSSPGCGMRWISVIVMNVSLSSVVRSIGSLQYQHVHHCFSIKVYRSKLAWSHPNSMRAPLERPPPQKKNRHFHVPHSEPLFGETMTNLETLRGKWPRKVDSRQRIFLSGGSPLPSISSFRRRRKTSPVLARPNSRWGGRSSVAAGGCRAKTCWRQNTN